MEDKNFTFFNQELSSIGRVMDVCLNFCVVVDRVCPDDKDIHLRASQLCEDIVQMAKDKWNLS